MATISDLNPAEWKLDNELVSSIASLLNSTGVPSLLWGNYLLSVYGVPTIIDGAGFIIPDDLVFAALSALLEAGFSPCTYGSECLYSWENHASTPYKHLHIDSQRGVSLYRKSDLIWEFGDLTSSLDNPDTMAASDNRLPVAYPGGGRGRFLTEPCPVIIPSAVKYCEALILLLCRDFNSTREDYWLSMLSYMLEYVDGSEILSESMLLDRYRSFYQAVKLGDPAMWAILYNLRLGLADGYRLH